jgi:(E)-4-hydroxy-3-methylbut-2-enyl-diphosphate synthase
MLSSDAQPLPWPRRKTRQVMVGQVPLGGDAPVILQSMTKAPTTRPEAVLEQIKRCAVGGAQIIRTAIPNHDALDGFQRICEESPLPVVADIHFDYRLAVEAARRGAAKLRINPGNIGGDDRLGPVVEAAAERGLPIRVGVNAGSLEKETAARHGGATAEACCESALRSVERVTRLGFGNLVVSIKASDVPRTVAANRLFAHESDLPLHLGITEAGFGESGTIKSAVGVGILLAEGIGDTLRVSLTDDPAEEVRVGRQILQSLGLRRGPELVSCPTCGRCRVDLPALAREVAKILEGVEENLVVAVMGCEVNGPGEAREADLGVAAGKGKVALFRRGEILRTVPFEDAAAAIRQELQRLTAGTG